MTDFEYHARLAREQRDAALTEHEHKRYSTVGHLALMAAEQAIEALASREGKHFHSILGTRIRNDWNGLPKNTQIHPTILRGSGA